MCLPLPGPRCSHHARTRLREASVCRDRAEADRDQARTAFAQTDTTDPVARERLREAAIVTDRAYSEAVAAHSTALREFECTPDGQRMLQEALDRLDPAEVTVAEQMAARLEEARATRRRQRLDLLLSRAASRRLDRATAEEEAALEAANEEVDSAQDAVERLEAEHARARSEWRALGRPVLETSGERMRASESVRESKASANLALDRVALLARGHYLAAGVSPRMADFYVADSREGCLRLSPESRTVTDAPRREMLLKVKPTGPDADRTRAARQAAMDDPQFQAANQEMATRIVQVDTDQAVLDEARQGEDTARAAWQQFNANESHARYAVEDARARADRAVADRASLRARIASGIGMDAPCRPLDVARLRDEVVVNPDGSTNAYVYDPPQPGFPDGRFLKVTGVRAANGGASNALVLANGEEALLQVYSRRGRSGTERVGYGQVFLTDPHEAARPLRELGNPNGGFAVNHPADG